MRSKYQFILQQQALTNGVLSMDDCPNITQVATTTFCNTAGPANHSGRTDLHYELPSLALHPPPASPPSPEQSFAKHPLG